MLQPVQEHNTLILPYTYAQATHATLLRRPKGCISQMRFRKPKENKYFCLSYTRVGHSRDFAGALERILEPDAEL